MLLKSCTRCGNLIPYGNTYCSSCKPIVDAEIAARMQQDKARSNRKYNKTRDMKLTRFYNSPDWKRLSEKRLCDDGYICAWCGKIAAEVDHIIEINTPEGWKKRLDYDNLRSLCHDCHNIRHNRFKRAENPRKTPGVGQKVPAVRRDNGAQGFSVEKTPHQNQNGG